MRKKKLCIITPLEGAYSETFIQNHIRYLDFEKVIIYGTVPEEYKSADADKYLFSREWYNRFRYKITTKLTGQPDDDLPQKALARFLKRKAISIVLAEYGPTGAMVANVCHELNIPLVVHFHGYDASVYSVLEEYRTLYADMFSKAAAIIAVSTAMVERLKQIGAAADKIKLNTYGVDIDLFKKNTPLNTKTFLSVGRFVDKKAPHLTILAFYKAFQQDKSIHLTMVGDGPLLNACKELVTALELTDNIKFAGIKTPAEVAILMNDAYAFLQHSVIAPDGNAEGTPLAILEAGAAGLPVVSTRHEGIADVIEHEVNGLLVNEFDIDAMAEAMIRLINNKNLVEELGTNARKKIERAYNLSDHIQKLENLLNTVSR
jgi:glycosyltransferase involved in cell wall biosynthesis